MRWERVLHRAWVRWNRRHDWHPRNLALTAYVYARAVWGAVRRRR